MRLLIQFISTNIKSITRERTAFFFTIIFPLIFVGVFGIAFQHGDPVSGPQHIGIINLDAGIPQEAIVVIENGKIMNGTELSKYFMDILKNATYPDSSTKIFEITMYDSNERSTALRDIDRREIYGLLTIPENFSLGVMAAIRAQYENNSVLQAITQNWTAYPSTNYTTKLILEGDNSLQSFSIISTALRQITRTFFKLGKNDIVGGEVVIKGGIVSSKFTIFDYIAPGLFVYAVLQLMSSVATFSMKDVETGMLQRLRLTQFKPSVYLLGIVFSQLFVAIIQVPIMFFAASIFGFPITSKIVFAFLIALILGLSVIGIGLIAASLVKTQSAVGGLSAVIATPMAFLSSAFFPVPNPLILNHSKYIGGNSLGIIDLIPSTPAIRILRGLLIQGKSFPELSFDFTLLTILSILYIGIGIFLYWKKHFKPL